MKYLFKYKKTQYYNVLKLNVRFKLVAFFTINKQNSFQKFFCPKKCPNQKMHESESACFLVEASFEGQNTSQKQFFKR